MSFDKIKIGNYLNDNVKIALTEEEQINGLMYEPWPPPVMVFPYKVAKVRKFWMKNTISPLDIIFCNNDKIIGIFAGEPLSKELIGPNEPSDLVIELPRGQVKNHNIQLGDNVKLIYSVQTISKKIKINYCS